MVSRVVVGISGASGAIYAIRILQKLSETNHEVHLVVSNAAKITLSHECSSIVTIKQLEENYCSYYHDAHDIAASISSGSFATAGMVIAPCSVRTMSEIASGITSSLLTRAADVTLKERRKLILMLRETPLHLGHLRTMTMLSEMGAIMYPPIPPFYHHPQTLSDVVDHSVDRVLSMLGVKGELQEWKGLQDLKS